MQPISLNTIKWLTSLQIKKNRKVEHVFIAEGKKVIEDLLKYHANLKMIITNSDNSDWVISKGLNHFIADDKQFKKISSLTTPPGLMAVFSCEQILTSELKIDQRSLILDGIKDPGNMGTIIRTAHWFGIKTIYMTGHCTDPFAPKVVQATMGSLVRCKFYEVTDDNELIQLLKFNKIPVICASMNGNDYSNVNVENFALVIGSESQGVSEFWKEHSDKIVQIPPIDMHDHPESLNASIATALMLNKFVRL